MNGLEGDVDYVAYLKTKGVILPSAVGSGSMAVADDYFDDDDMDHEEDVEADTAVGAPVQSPIIGRV